MAPRELKPIYIKNNIWNGTYRRDFSGDYHCTPSEIKSMLRDQPDASIDMKVIENLTIDQLNKDTIQRYRNRHKLMKPGHTWSTYNDADYLEMIGAAAIGKDNKLHPTAAGLLMFGDEFRIVREFPEYFLDYREMLDPTIRWTDRFYSSTGEWSGNLFDFYFGVYNRIIKDLKVPFKMIGGDRIDDTPVHKVIREILANCLVNTDFYIPRGIVIKKDQNQLVLENPGSIRVGKAQILKGGESDPRNKALMKMFNMIEIGERAGSGIPTLFSVWKEQGLEEPIIDERFGKASRTIITLSFKEANEKSGDKKVAIKSDDKKVAIKSGDKISNKTKEKINIILNMMKKDTLYNADDFCEVLNVKISRTKFILKIMVDEGLIETIGANKNRKYKLNK